MISLLYNIFAGPEVHTLKHRTYNCLLYKLYARSLIAVQMYTHFIINFALIGVHIR